MYHCHEMALESPGPCSHGCASIRYKCLALCEEGVIKPGGHRYSSTSESQCVYEKKSNTTFLRAT